MTEKENKTVSISDILKGNVKDVKQALTSIDDQNVLIALAETEAEGQNRTGVIAAIETILSRENDAGDAPSIADMEKALAEAEEGPTDSANARHILRLRQELADMKESEA